MTGAGLAGRLPARLLVIADFPREPGACRHLAARIDRMVREGEGPPARWLWIRAKNHGPGRYEALCRGLRARDPDGRTVLAIQDHPALAAGCLPASLHLSWGGFAQGIRPVPGFGGVWGVSAHDGNELEAAARAGAHYVTLSPVFAPVSKPGARPGRGTGWLAARLAGVSVPVLALGGIDAGRVAACIRAGAFGVAVSGAVWGAARPARQAEDLVRALERAGACAG